MAYKYGGTEFDAHLPLPPMTDPKPRKERTRGPAQCGTRSGYVAHRKAGEATCQDCRDANQAYNVEYEKRRAAREIKKGWTGDKCGTTAGFRSHYRHAVPACEPCRQANADACKERREVRESA